MATARAFACPKQALVAMCLAGVTVAGVLPGTAGFADPPPNIAEVAVQVVTLQTQAEQASEAYNGAHVALDQAQREVDAATAQVADSGQRLREAQARIGVTVAAAYRNGASEQMLTLVSADDPKAMIDRTASLARLGRDQGDQVAAAVQAKSGLERAQAAVADGLATARRLDADMAAHRAQVEQSLAQQQQLLDRLTVDQQGQLGHTQAAADGGSSGLAAAAVPETATGAAGAAVAAAYTQLGKPYVWGAAGPSSFDCSGLTQYVWAQAGRSLPHFTGAQWAAGTRVPRGQERPGDLVFFGADLHHMGIYIGNGKMINAPHTGDVVRIADAFRAGYQGAVRL